MSDPEKTSAKRRIRYFVSYSHQDHESRIEGPKLEEFKRILMTKMKLSPEYEFQPWDDFQILPGEKWLPQIESRLAECDFGLVIVSENLLASDFITAVELPVFIEGERPFVPLAFGVLDFTRDVKGLQDHQVFRLRRTGEPPRALAQCNTVELRNAFVTALVHQIEEKLRRQTVPRESSPAKAVAAKSPAALEADLRNVFGQEFDRIKGEFEKNQPLRDLVVRAFGIPKGSPEETTLRLMVMFYTNFLDSLGRYSQIYHESEDKEGYARVVASCIYLAMDADYARDLRETRGSSSYPISSEARDGIITLLLRWTGSQAPRLLEDFLNRRPANSPECLPTQRFDDIRINLFRRYAIDPKDSDADTRLAEKLAEERRFGTPLFQKLHAGEAETIQRIQSEHSPLKDLLVLIVTDGHSIDPAVENFDRQFESYLDRFLKTFSANHS